MERKQLSSQPSWPPGFSETKLRQNDIAPFSNVHPSLQAAFVLSAFFPLPLHVHLSVTPLCLHARSSTGLIYCRYKYKYLYVHKCSTAGSFPAVRNF